MSTIFMPTDSFNSPHLFCLISDNISTNFKAGCPLNIPNLFCLRWQYTYVQHICTNAYRQYPKSVVSKKTICPTFLCSYPYCSNISCQLFLSTGTIYSTSLCQDLPSLHYTCGVCSDNIFHICMPLILLIALHLFPQCSSTVGYTVTIFLHLHSSGSLHCATPVGSTV